MRNLILQGVRKIVSLLMIGHRHPHLHTLYRYGQKAVSKPMNGYAVRSGFPGNA